MANFNVTYHGFDAASRAAFDFAIGVWSAELVSNVDIEVDAHYGTPLGPLIGLCVPNGARGFANAPNPNWWYTSALADKLSGADQQPGEPDMAIYFPNRADWYFATDGNPGPAEYDFPTNALHEICHGLGFLGLFSVETRHGIEFGHYGQITAGMLPPGVVLPFPLPNLDGWASAMGATICDAAGAPMLAHPNQQSCRGGEEELGARLRSQGAFGQPHLVGAGAVPPGAPGRYAAYAPDPFQLFSSLDHLDANAFPASLMRPALGVGQAIHTPDDPVLDILQALGW